MKVTMVLVEKCFMSLSLFVASLFSGVKSGKSGKQYLYWNFCNYYANEWKENDYWCMCNSRAGFIIKHHKASFIILKVLLHWVSSIFFSSSCLRGTFPPPVHPHPHLMSYKTHMLNTEVLLFLRLSIINALAFCWANIYMQSIPLSNLSAGGREVCL